MLLREVATKSTQIGDITHHEPDLKNHMSWDSSAVSITLRPTKEMLHHAQAYGMLDAIIPTVGAYIYPQTPTPGQDFLTKNAIDVRTKAQARNMVGVKDAMKERNPLHVMSAQGIQAICTAAVEKLLKTQTSGNIIFNSVQKALRDKNSVLIPLGSSSQLNKKFVRALRAETGLPVVDILEQAEHKLSKFVYTKGGGYRPRVKFPKRYLDGNENIQVHGQGKGLEDHRRGLYGGQNVRPDADMDMLEQLTGKNIILVDDNFEEGGSFVNAAMAVLEYGIVPEQFFGVTIHHFQNMTPGMNYKAPDDDEEPPKKKKPSFISHAK